MQDAIACMNVETVSASGIEVLDPDHLDEVTGGVLPALVAAAAWGFGVGFAGTAALIAGVWASDD
jgi:hypothetical protein